MCTRCSKTEIYYNREYNIDSKSSVVLGLLSHFISSSNEGIYLGGDVGG